MSTETNTESETKSQHSDRYRYIEYDADGGPVSIIQDTENQRAWIQSTVSVVVEP